MLDILQSDTLNFEIPNIGSRSIIITMFSEISDVFSNYDFPLNEMIFPLMVFDMLLIFGIIIFILGMVILLVDLKNYQATKRKF